MKVHDIRLLIAAVLICFWAGACERPQWNKAEKMKPDGVDDWFTARMLEQFPDAKPITQEQLDSMRNASIANDTTEFKITAHFILARRHEANGRYAEAEADYRHIIKYGDKEEVHDAQEALAGLYYGQGLYSKALATLPDSLSVEGIAYEAAAIKHLSE